MAFEGKNPTTPLEQELFGGEFEVPERARRELTVVCGRGSGKTMIFAAARLLHLCLLVDLSEPPPGSTLGLARGEPAFAIVVACDKPTAAQTLSFIEGFLETLAMRGVVYRPPTDGEIVLRRDGRDVIIQCVAASARGASVRGRSIICFVMDELAFLRDEKYGINDKDQYDAAWPRVMFERGGQMIVCSSPWAELGLLWDHYSSNFGAPKTTLVAHAPTGLMRPELRERIEEEKKLNPAEAERYSREFDALFTANASFQFFKGSDIHNAYVRDGERASAPVPYKPWCRYAAGADFAFKSDHSAVVVAQWDGHEVTVVDAMQMAPTKDEALKPSHVVASFAPLLRSYELADVMADSHSREAIREHLDTHGLVMRDAPHHIVETFGRVRSLLMDGRLKIPARFEHLNLRPKANEFRAQLRAVQWKLTAGGNQSIELPRRRKGAGGHCDLVSALVLAVWQLVGETADEVPGEGFRPGTHAWDMAILKKQQEESLQRALKKAGARASEEDAGWAYDPWEDA